MDEAMNDCIEDWLRLRHSKLPLSVALKLVTQLGGAGELLQCPASELPAVADTGQVAKALRATNKQGIQNDLRWCTANDSHHVISCLDQRYPTQLRQLADAPLLLYVDGEPSLLNSRQLAIVGSRNPTPTGSELAFRFAANLTRMGLVITSGLAFGIDASAHRGALSAPGPTIAVMATGLDRVYPRRHQKLARQVAEWGVLLSEMPLGTPPRRHFFPQRNRIISGLSAGTLVVEAAQKSGSLITARLAGEQGREVYAVPGSILSAQSRGCHALLRDGASLVESEEDILTELKHLCPSPHVGSFLSMDPDCQLMLNFMGYDPVAIDTLVRRSGLTAGKVCSMLSRMELQGVIRMGLGGNYIRLR